MTDRSVGVADRLHDCKEMFAGDKRKNKKNDGELLLNARVHRRVAENQQPLDQRLGP
jgi:hypothetical protein